MSHIINLRVSTVKQEIRTEAGLTVLSIYCIKTEKTAHYGKLPGGQTAQDTGLGRNAHHEKYHCDIAGLGI